MLRAACILAAAIGFVGPEPVRAQAAPSADHGQALRHALASAVVPGSGQFLQGRRRWIVFLAAEAAAWTFHLDARQAARRFRSRYQELAWSVARGAPVPRQDGGFEYYERMGQWLRSGRFDADPGTTEIEPERDPQSYNGAQWNLAASIYLEGDPDVTPGAAGYAEALEYYRQRAYAAEFEWDWTSAPEEQGRFRELIERSDDRFRRASVALAAVAANHLIAAVDAFASSRADLRSPVQVSLEPGPWRGAGPYLVFRYPLPKGFQ